MGVGAVAAVIAVGMFAAWWWLRSRAHAGTAPMAPGARALAPLPPQLREAAARGSLVQMASSLRELRDGRWNERSAVLATLGPYLRRAELDAALAGSPDDATLLLMRAEQAVEWAWEARGEGAASGVDRDGWSRFAERMRLASADLERAAALDPPDPVPLARLVEVARHLKQGEDVARRHLDAAIARNPTDYAARSTFFAFFCARRYGGSYEKMRAFAEEAARGAPDGDLRHAFRYRAHRELWSYEHGFGTAAAGDAHAADPKVRAEVIESYERSVGHPMHRDEGLATLRLRADFASWFFLVRDRERCRDALVRSGGLDVDRPWQELGRADAKIAEARAWAMV